MKNVYASPVAADGRLYLAGRDGSVAVVRDAVKARVDRMQSMREKFRERMQSRAEALAAEQARGQRIPHWLVRPRIYARILARAAEEEVTPSSERPQIATPVLEATSATKLGQVLELVDGGSEDETQA